jgi:hypothetical protein
VVDKITPADISDPQEVIARAKALSDELATPITPRGSKVPFPSRPRTSVAPEPINVSPGC